MSIRARFLFACLLTLSLLPGLMAGHAAAAEPSLTADWRPLDDQTLVQTATRLGSEGLLSRLEAGTRALAEYELWMRRQEQLADGWNDKPFVHYIKYRHSPRQVYMAWLKGGPKAGQEMIYDETRRKDAMYGHLAGLFNVMSMWTPLDGSLARSNSQHSVRDIGLQSIVDILHEQQARRKQAGVRLEPDLIEVSELAGQRVLAVTWVTPAGLPKGYAHKTRLYLDLQQPWVRQIESWDEQGRLQERVWFEKIQPAHFTTRDFDPANPDYRF